MRRFADSNVMAVLLLGLAAAAVGGPEVERPRGFVYDRYRMPRATDGNRRHTERAPEGSAEAEARKAAAEYKRARKAAKRSQSAKPGNQS